MKIKRVVRVSSASKPKEPTEQQDFNQSNTFVANCKKYEYSIPQLRSFLSQEYTRVFPSNPYPENEPMELIRLAIAYELTVRDYKAKNLPVPEKVARNRQAAIKFNVAGFDEILRGILEEKIKAQGENETMKTKTAVLVRKAPKVSPEAKAKINVAAKTESKSKLTAGQRYAQIFDTIGAGKKLTDSQILETIKKEYPGKKHDLSKVAVYRGYYNNGRIAGQKGKPKVSVSEHKAK
jgi:hypothetical protein